MSKEQTIKCATCMQIKYVGNYQIRAFFVGVVEKPRRIHGAEGKSPAV